MARLLEARASGGAFSRERILASSSYLARLARSIEISFAFASWGFCFRVSMSLEVEMGEEEGRRGRWEEAYSHSP